MKYILTNKNYFSHIGTDPVENSIPLDFDSKFSKQNPPTKFYYWSGDEFVLDKDMYHLSLIDQAKILVCKKCDNLEKKLLKNETYSYANDYLTVKESLISEIKQLRGQIPTFSSLSIKQLEQLVELNS